MAITLAGYVLDQAGTAKAGVTVEAWWHNGAAAAASTTTDVNGLWTHAALDATKTWVIKIIDGTKVLKIDARSQIQITTADVITSINVDTINEHTAATGVTIDGVLIKDGLVDGVDVSTLTGNQVAAGNYAGNDGENRQITTGFICKAVFIVSGTSQWSLLHTTPANNIYHNQGVNKHDACAGSNLHAANGFTVSKTADAANNTGTTYYYFAIA